MAPEASIVPDVSPNRETACSVRSSSAGQALICGSRRPVVSAIRGCASCSRAGPTRSRWWHSPPRPRVSSGPCWSKEKFTATAPARRLLPDLGRQPPRSRSCLSEGQLWRDGKWAGNRDRNTPYRHRASQRAAMIGIRSAFSIRARGQRPLLEAVYMTAPRFTCRNTKNALAERGPSIHDGLIFIGWISSQALRMRSQALMVRSAFLRVSNHDATEESTVTRTGKRRSEARPEYLDARGHRKRWLRAFACRRRSQQRADL